MHSEMKQIIELVKATTDPVKTVVEKYFASVTWTTLKDEYSRMSKAEKAHLHEKLDMVRGINKAIVKLSPKGKRK
jgi:hypothetical protein